MAIAIYGLKLRNQLRNVFKVAVSPAVKLWAIKGNKSARTKGEKTWLTDINV
jgi:hypothetical protein